MKIQRCLPAGISLVVTLAVTMMGLCTESYAEEEPAKQESGEVQLPSHAAQLGRLNFRFLSADGSGKEIIADDSSAICGWLLPNHLDNSLAVYDNSGSSLGEIVHFRSGKSKWFERPGALGNALTPADIANPVLREVVTSLIALKAPGLGDFLEVIDETLWSVDPLGGRDDQALSVLVGRPLAVVQARLDLERDVSGAQPPQLPNTEIDKIEAVSIPVKIGNLKLRNDGLIGYYAGGSYGNFYALHIPPKQDPAGHYIRQIGKGEKNFIHLTFNGPPKTVTIIMDPRGVVHAAAGTMPTKSIALPVSAVEKAIKRLRVTFRTGPVITPADPRVQLPAESDGIWNWTSRHTEGGDTNARKIAPNEKGANDARPPGDQQDLVEGWLQLTKDASESGGDGKAK